MKLIKLTALGLALMIGVVGCTNLSGKEDTMKKESTEQSTMMKDDHGSEDTMKKDDAMADDNMKKDDAMADDNMKKDDAMTDDNMKKDDAMTDDNMKKDDAMADDNMKKEDTMEVMNKGKEAPTFELMDLDGNTHNLADYKGEKVYVKYWASWCSICLAGLDELNTLAGEDNDFKVLTIVSPGYKGEKSTEDFKSWFAGLDNADNITVLLDEGGTIASQYGVRGYPTSAYIGSDGILVKTQPGHNGNDLIKDSFSAIH